MTQPHHKKTGTSSPNRKPSQGTGPSLPTGAHSTTNGNCDLQKGEPRHSKSNKMKRQRNMQQTKEHRKNPLHKINEEEIGNQPEKESRELIIKMIQNLGNKKRHR